MSINRISNNGLALPAPWRTARAWAALKSQSAKLQAALGRFLRVTGSRRETFFMIGDGLTTVLATLAAFRFALSRAQFVPANALLLGTVLSALVIVANFAFRNYRLAWVTFSLADLRRLAAAVVLVVLVVYGLVVFTPLGKIDMPHPVVWGAILFLALATFRGSKRLLVEPVFAQAEGKRTLVVMSSRHAYFLPNLLRRMGDFDYYITGIIDPDPNQVGNYEQGIEVLGTTDDLEAVIERYGIEVVLVLLEANPGFSLGDLYARLHRIGSVEVKTMPSLVDVIEDRSDLGALEKLCIHELTGRPPVPIDVSRMRRVFGGRRILVTGAGGSIGSELCRQLARFEPAALVLFERDDSNLFYIDREVRQNHPGLELIPVLGDITHEPDVTRAFERYRPEIVFHAAAYKHVPILEFHPEDAVRVNVLGTHLLARTAVRSGTDCFVYISTDKAVNPTSTMGASKRLGEMLAVSMNGLSDMRVMAVRFGNVLDSRGSVTTLFRDAIARRQPITVTDREMKRYFMLTSESVLLVLQAAALGRGGEVFVLDMGEPVRIWDLAHRMVELAGLTPNVDIPIIVTGMRPGEKLFEELLTAEEGTVATENDRIFQARISRHVCYPDLALALQQLEQALPGLDRNAIKQELARLVPNYRPDLCTGLLPSCHLSVSRAA
ncbi:MAG: nucleoside-diphosphate sugar epimerase/dehydratase [candidate division WOR-3 bacterium]